MQKHENIYLLAKKEKEKTEVKRWQNTIKKRGVISSNEILAEKC